METTGGSPWSLLKGKLSLTIVSSRPEKRKGWTVPLSESNLVDEAGKRRGRKTRRLDHSFDDLGPEGINGEVRGELHDAGAER